MAKFESESSVLRMKIQDKIFFRTAIPKKIALDLLNLKTDIPKQRLKWKVEKNKIIIEKK